MADIYCFSFVEDEPSAAVLRKLVESRNASSECSRILLREGFPKVVGGYGQIKKRVESLLQMARSEICTLVLADLDREECAPALIRKWFAVAPGQPIELPCRLSFRVAVREVEAWLLADRDALARFLEISVANIPRRPDDLNDPKRELLDIIRRKCRKSLRQDMLPSGTAHVGARYNRRLCKYVVDKWKPERAASNSPSLQRATEALSRF